MRRTTLVAMVALRMFNISLQQTKAGTVYLDIADGWTHDITYDYEQDIS